VDVRPVVKTALRRLWRDPTTLQIGVLAHRAVVVGGVGDRAAGLVAALDGAHDDQALRLRARGLGLDEAVVERLVAMLAEAEVLDDAATDAGVLAELPRRDRDRLAPDVASLSLVSGQLDGGLASVSRRWRASLGIVGAGRVGSAIATLLAAAGVGHITVDDPATCRLSDCAPAGVTAADAGTSRAQAAHAAIHRVSESTRTSQLGAAQRHDLVVLAPPGASDPNSAQALVRAGIPHITATVREATAVVGPLVVPGETACLRCLDLHRTDRDPGWPVIAAQLATDGRRSGVEACDVALATLAASTCALQVLSFIDGARPATCNGTLELALPDWRIRRRTWLPHPACGCDWGPEPTAPRHLAAEAAEVAQAAEHAQDARTMQVHGPER
jgi:bacteriocin biosynthesis cyclodehydratase domain-containing protein